jgi:predicted nucleic acid-binding protein
MIVVDASAALATVLDSQATPAADAFFAGDLPELIAPAIFAFEMRNALLRAERRGLTDADIVDEASVELSALIECRPWNARPADLVRLMALARRENLSLFDAAYLDLAEQEKAAIASRDASLLEAARRRSLTVYDLR